MNILFYHNEFCSKYSWIFHAIPIFYCFLPFPCYWLEISFDFDFLNEISEFYTNDFPVDDMYLQIPVFPDKRKRFPPIEKGTYRVVITACANEKEIPQFDPKRTTFANCHVLSECKEAPSYLDFLINWYDNLTEEVVVFVHGHVKSWHITNTEKAVYNAATTPYFWEQPYGGFIEGKWKKICDNVKFQELYSYFYDNTTMPRVWNRYSTYPCCATFFVRTEQIRKRPKSDYINILNNLRKWMTINHGQSYFCGRLFEYTWHILFTGRNHVPTPPGKIDWMFNRQGNICPFTRSDVL